MSDITNADGVETQIELVKIAITEDDAKELKKILTDRLIGIDTVIDEKSGNDLLHFAVDKRAPECVRLLLGHPYNADPDKENSCRQTAIEMAAEWADLPVILPLLAISCDTHSLWSQFTCFTVHSKLTDDSRRILRLLAYPHHFLCLRGKVKSLEKLHHKLWKTNMYFLNNEIAPVSIHLKISAAHILLFYELVMAIPFDWASPRDLSFTFWPWSISSDHDALQCHDYPNCVTMPRLRMYPYQMERRWFKWKSHQCSQNYHQVNASETTDGRSQSNLYLTPLPIVHQCRIKIRQLLTKQLYNQPNAMPRDDDHDWFGKVNYVKSISQLPIPTKIKEFLSYKDVWPDYTRDGIPM